MQILPVFAAKCRPRSAALWLLVRDKGCLVHVIFIRWRLANAAPGRSTVRGLRRMSEDVPKIAWPPRHGDRRVGVAVSARDTALAFIETERVLADVDAHRGNDRS